MKKTSTTDTIKLMKKRQREGRRIIGNKQEVIKTVGQNSKNSGRIYLPGSWIGKKVLITLVKK